MFSNYKNTVSGKALMEFQLTKHDFHMEHVFPGSRSDSCLAEKSGVLDWVEPEHELTSDKGFSVQEHCSIKRVFLNHPPQKCCKQFCHAEKTSNFDIAECRIHVERFISCVRDWST